MLQADARNLPVGFLRLPPRNPHAGFLGRLLNLLETPSAGTTEYGIRQRIRQPGLTSVSGHRVPYPLICLIWYYSLLRSYKRMSPKVELDSLALEEQTSLTWRHRSAIQNLRPVLLLEKLNSFSPSKPEVRFRETAVRDVHGYHSLIKLFKEAGSNFEATGDVLADQEKALTIGFIHGI